MLSYCFTTICSCSHKLCLLSAAHSAVVTTLLDVATLLVAIGVPGKWFEHVFLISHAMFVFCVSF